MIKRVKLFRGVVTRYEMRAAYCVVILTLAMIF